MDDMGEMDITDQTHGSGDVFSFLLFVCKYDCMTLIQAYEKEPNSFAIPG